MSANQIALEHAPNATQGPRLRHPPKQRKKEEESGRPEKGVLGDKYTSQGGKGHKAGEKLQRKLNEVGGKVPKFLMQSAIQVPPVFLVTGNSVLGLSSV